MTTVNCAATGLEPYVPSPDVPWDQARAQHLYRRLGFGAHPNELPRAIAEGPAVTVERLLTEAATRTARPAPEWAFWDALDFREAELTPNQAFNAWNQGFIEEALAHGVREKLSLFWQDHFAASYTDYNCPSSYYQYLTVIETHAFGDFRAFVKAMTVTPAMLIFLNGYENTKDSPNENYARELFELFTLGENNGYTQEDIVEASRALTGWNDRTRRCGLISWNEATFDDSDKTVFGQTGPFNDRQLIDVLFAERPTQIAGFICRKLYAYYVNTTVDEAVVNQLAQTLLDNDFQIMPVLKQLMSSAHFFDEANVGVLIKSPVEVVVSFLRQGGFPSFDRQLPRSLSTANRLGQSLGRPPDVAGWEGDRAWIDSNRITLRWQFIDSFTGSIRNHNRDSLPALARQLTEDSNSPEIIARTVTDYFVPRALVREEAYELATDILKGDIPENYYETGEWNLFWDSASLQMLYLLRHIGRMPEFQLN